MTRSRIIARVFAVSLRTSLLASCLLFVSACDGSTRLRSAPAARTHSTPQGSTTPEPTRDSELEKVLEGIRERHAVPGLAAAIVRAGAVEARAVAGVRRLGAPDRLQLADRFHIASCTKSMTATVAAMLVEEGRLGWQSRLVDVIPELSGTIRPEFRSATLERLLGHAARYPAYTQFGPARLEELVALRGSSSQQRLAFLTDVLASEPPNPGTGDAAYSNVGYTAAAAMMERATATAWEDLVTRRLFAPLGLTSVGFGWPATARTPDQPRGHVRRDGRLVEQPLDDAYVLPVVLWPAGAVNASIGDIARYAADQLDGLRGRKALLREESYRRLHRTLGGETEGFTLGWGVRNDPDLGIVHYGAGSGGTFFVRITIVPDRDLAIVVASNSGEAAAATKEVISTLLAAPARGGAHPDSVFAERNQLSVFEKRRTLIGRSAIAAKASAGVWRSGRGKQGVKTS
ncbi:MAG: beta-lactamase family protein [Gemmatimonadetes bacterium]|nr:beta-lactamase family protein [Gemmatimonadota bacterium]